MEIGELQVSIGSGSAGGVDWNWLQQQVRGAARPRLEQLRGELGQLLFGVALSPEQMLEYRVKLAEVLELLEHLEQPVAPVPSDLIVPRSQRLFPVGALGWQPAPVLFGEPYAATPTQVLEKRKIAELHRLLQRGQEVCTHAVQIRLTQGLQVREGGSDTVLLSPGGLHELTHPTTPPVTVLRLPPRVFKQVDILRVARGA
jgi:hypothetical protein